jgi:hypothetical protein
MPGLVPRNCSESVDGDDNVITFVSNWNFVPGSFADKLKIEYEVSASCESTGWVPDSDYESVDDSSLGYEDLPKLVPRDNESVEDFLFGCEELPSLGPRNVSELDCGSLLSRDSDQINWEVSLEDNLGKLSSLVSQDCESQDNSSHGCEEMPGLVVRIYSESVDDSTSDCEEMPGLAPCTSFTLDCEEMPGSAPRTSSTSDCEEMTGYTMGLYTIPTFKSVNTVPAGRMNSMASLNAKIKSGGYCGVTGYTMFLCTIPTTKSVDEVPAGRIDHDEPEPVMISELIANVAAGRIDQYLLIGATTLSAAASQMATEKIATTGRKMETEKELQEQLDSLSSSNHLKIGRVGASSREDGKFATQETEWREAQEDGESAAQTHEGQDGESETQMHQKVSDAEQEHLIKVQSFTKVDESGGAEGTSIKSGTIELHTTQLEKRATTTGKAAKKLLSALTLGRMSNCHSVRGQCPTQPLLSTLTLGRMSNCHSVRGQCPTQPTVFYTEARGNSFM